MNDEQTEADSETIIDALRERIEQLEEELADALRRTTDKKSDIDSYKTIAGLWEVDHEETDSGSGKFHYYFIVNDQNKIVCDALNSNVITIETDVDFGRVYRWDSQGKKDLTRLVECRNAMIGVEKPAEFMQAVVELVNAIGDVPELNPSNYHHDDVADCEQAKGQMFAVWNRLRVVGGKAVS